MLGRSGRFRSAFLLMSLIATAIQAADSSPVRSSSATITVSATNAPYIRATTGDRPEFLEITAEDIERGYIDVSDAGSVVFQTNHPEGTTLIISIDESAILSAKMSAGEVERSVGPAGGWIQLPFEGTMVRRLPLSCRLTLRADAAPGRIAWPIRVEARMAGSRRSQ